MSNRKALSGSRLLACLLTALTILAWAPSSGTAAPPAAGPSRVEVFLADLQKASTGAQAAALLEKANLSEAELKLVAQELGKPSWTGKLDAFKRTAPPSTAHPPTPLLRKGTSAQQVVSDVRLSLEQAQATRLATAKQALLRRLSALRATANASPPRTTLRPAGGGLMQGRSPFAGDPATAAHIDGIRPSPVVVGETLTIVGSRFGATPGRVVIWTEDGIIECGPHLTWSDRQITVRIPREARPWSSMRDVPPNVHDDGHGGRFGDTGRFRPAANLEARIWVKLAGGETGPLHPIEIGPDLTLLTPAIDSVAPSALEPGSEVVIEGRNFGNQPDPHTSIIRLELKFGGTAIRLDASEWRDSYIVATVWPDTSRVGRLSGGILKVANRLALEAIEGGITFTPAVEVAEIERGPFRASCHPLGFPPLCLFGDSNTFPAYDFALQNGWTVQESWIDIIESHSQGANYGGYFERPPEDGSATLRTGVVAWADAYSMVECRAHVVVSGPRGTSFR